MVMKDPYFVGLLALFTLLGAAVFVFYGPEPDMMGTAAALFLIPAGIGALVSHAVDQKGEQSPMGCFFWPTAGIIAAALLAWVAIGEGAICIAMILPLWLPAAIAGALIQHINRRRRLAETDDANNLFVVAWAALPLAALPLELQLPQQWETRTVSREIVVDGTPDALWPLLVSIPDVRAGEGKWNVTHNLFGVPRPTDAVLVDRGGTAVRLARWDRGIRFEEKITKYSPAREICWNFAFPDNSVQRETDRHISPDGPFLKIASGCYTLRQSHTGQTMVKLETTYRMRVRLGGYFARWGEILLGDVQSNILQIVSDRATAAAGTSAAGFNAT